MPGELFICFDKFAIVWLGAVMDKGDHFLEQKGDFPSMHLPRLNACLIHLNTAKKAKALVAFFAHFVDHNNSPSERRGN